MDSDKSNRICQLSLINFLLSDHSVELVTNAYCGQTILATVILFNCSLLQTNILSRSSVVFVEQISLHLRERNVRTSCTTIIARDERNQSLLENTRQIETRGVECSDKEEIDFVFGNSKNIDNPDRKNGTTDHLKTFAFKQVISVSKNNSFRSGSYPLSDHLDNLKKT